MVVEDIQIYGIYKGNQIKIKDSKMKANLGSRGYGKTIDKSFMLEPHEALYLLYKKELRIIFRKKELDFIKFLKKCVNDDNAILLKFLIYRDLRIRGYVVKSGFGIDNEFGSGRDDNYKLESSKDFRVYERGQKEKAAKYVVFGFSEGKKEKIKTLKEKIEQCKKMTKDVIVAVIDRRGEIIYYEISSKEFPENI